MRKCFVCMEIKEKMFVCSICKTMQYCSIECQIRDRENHKKACNIFLSNTSGKVSKIYHVSMFWILNFIARSHILNSNDYIPTIQYSKLTPDKATFTFQGNRNSKYIRKINNFPDTGVLLCASYIDKNSLSKNVYYCIVTTEYYGYNEKILLHDSICKPWNKIVKLMQSVRDIDDLQLKLRYGKLYICYDNKLTEYCL
jgi:hypothetical protein